MSGVEYLDLAGIAERAGLTASSVKTYHKRATANRVAGDPRPGDLPPEDIRLGRTPGWSSATIDAWLAGRPRAGKMPEVDLPAVGDDLADGDGDAIGVVTGLRYADGEIPTVVYSDARDFEVTVSLARLRRLDHDIDPDRVMGWMVHPEG